MRIIFMGTPEFSVAPLKALIEAGHDILCIYTQPPRPAGRRGLDLKLSPVHQMGMTYNIEVRTPVSLKSQDEQQKFDVLNADIAIVVAYGLLLPKAILESPEHGCYNAHGSLLPRWRGAAPIQRAIMAGDQETGMMIMKMQEGLDKGPIALVQKVPINSEMTFGVLHDQLKDIGACLVVKAIDQLEKGNLPLTKQSGDGVIYAQKIDKAETRIDFERPALDVHHHIMGLSPFPGAWFEHDQKRVKVLASGYVGEITGLYKSGTVIDDQLTIACVTGAVQLRKLQKAGGKPMSAIDFLRGNMILKDTQLV